MDTATSKKINQKLFKEIIIITIILIAQFGIDIIIENKSSSWWGTLEKYSPYLITVIMFTVFHFVYKKKVLLYKKEIDLRDDKLKDTSKIIWEKYHDLHNFKLNEVINKSLKEFIINTPEVLSIQIYSYLEFKHKKDKYIKINYKYGYAENGNNINAILQDHFYIEDKIYMRVKGILETQDLKKHLRFVKGIVTYLNKKSLNLYTEYDCIKYHLAELILQRTFKLSGINKRIVNILNDKEKDLTLRQMKRSGILKGILLKDFYFFINNKGIKKNRGYLTKTIYLENCPHVVLFSFHSDVIISSEKLSLIGQNYIDNLNLIINGK